ncbi:hypothetical protein [Marinigracilibium pacificum]|uniref:2TM domain-containing protein n=1 Tax=Marinigracilibium pacificum TaxID=2729599 RepID=A0A848J0J0_9BACT|nr:hypothetical protein [Marinigracilibium pacificum]NMM50303.1 hypothetical protein [Marinigracilibium pacificum]
MANIPFFGKKKPRYKRFDYQPRIYDPVKERIENKRKQYLADINNPEVSKRPEDRKAFRLQLEENLRRHKRNELRAQTIRWVIILLVISIGWAWLEWGNKVFTYIGWAIIPIYLIYRFRNIFKSKE